MAAGGSGGVSRLRRALAVLGVGAGVRVGPAGAAGGREEVRDAGDYQLRTRVLHAGTRSEGRVGRLFHGGVEVPGRTPGKFIEVTTAQGVVRFTCLGEARPHLWSASGWTDRTPLP